jgi:hypothetical protein
MAHHDRKDEEAPSVAEDSAGAGHGATTAERGGSSGSARLVDRGSFPRRIASLRVGALGLSAWGVSIAVPLSEGGAHSPADVVLAVLPLIALGVGIRFFASARAESTPLLAIAFPALIATAMAGRADPALSERYGTQMIILSGVAMLAYVVAAAHALARPSVLRETRVSKLAASPDGSGRARALRLLVVGTAAVAALVIAVVMPALGSHASFAATWGASADEGRVLVAIVAAAVTTLGLTVIIAPALRAPRPGEVRQGADSVTIAASLVVAVTGVMAWAILQFIEVQ